MYISDLHARSALAMGTPAKIPEKGTRLGSHALLILLRALGAANQPPPALVRVFLKGRIACYARAESTDSFVGSRLGLAIPESVKIPLTTLWAWSHIRFAARMLGTLCVSRIISQFVLHFLTAK